MRPTGLISASALFMLTLVGSVCVGAAARQDADDLPDGEGRKILRASCTACHDLKEVTKFRGYYTKNEWRDIVVTMIEYGATVADKDVEVLVDYLAKTLGKPAVANP